MAIRTYGLSGSGMDVDQMVKDLMKARRTQYNTVYKKKTQLEWKKADYSTMYKTTWDFRNTVFDSKSRSNLIVRKASSTNTAAVTATAAATAGNGTHSIEVRRLAEGVSQTSSAVITTGTSKESLVSQFGMASTKFDITVGNGTAAKTITIDPTKSIYEVVNSINSAGVNVYANYDATIDRFFLSTGNTGTISSLNFSGSSAAGVDFLVNKLKLSPTAATDASGVTSTGAINATLASQFGFAGPANLKLTNGGKTTTVSIEATDSLASLASKISAASGVNASASFDSTTGKFSIKSTSGTLDLITGSDAAAVSLLTGDLKLAGLGAISDTGTTSSSALAAPASNIALATQFSKLAGSFELTLDDGDSKTVKINLATDSLDSVIKKLNDSGKAVASVDPATGKLTVKAVAGKTLNISTADPLGNTFLANDLKLGTLVGIDDASGVSSSASMYTLPEDMALSKQFEGLSGSLKFIVRNGATTKEITLDTATDTLRTFKNKLEAAGVNAAASYDAAARKFTISATSGTLDFSSSDSGALVFLTSNLKLDGYTNISSSGKTSTAAMFLTETEKSLQNRFADLNGGKLTFQIKNGSDAPQTLVLNTETDTMDSFVTKLNTLWPGSASYTGGKLTFNTGSALDFTGSDPAALDFLGSELNLGVMSKKGIDADITVDGADILQSANTFTVAGVTYTLNDKTPVGTPTKIVVSTDVDKIVENVKNFIETYNKTLESINTELNETYYKDYLPLTAEEQENLKETQIKAWEEKAKSGLLRNDQTLRDLVRNMRSNFTDAVLSVDSIYNSPSALGITTGDYSEGGKLYLNEAKLRQALNADPDVAYKVLGSSGDTTAQKGVLSRLYDSLKTATDSIASEGGKTANTKETVSRIGKQLDDYTKQLDRMNKRLIAEEKRYYKQFDAMEVALNRMTQQSSWLSQQLGG